MTTFESLGVSAPIARTLAALNFEKPTEIQAAAIPALKNGDDVIGVAQTGSGKTAAFVIPALERVGTYGERPKPGMPRALILAPTRELAIQITEAIKSLGSQTPVRCCTVYGGAPYKTQIHILRRGVDILVATPGRLQDHMKQGNIYLDETEYFVLDEADRMLDMGFVDEVRKISKQLPAGHQSVMFSATMNPAIRSLAETLLSEPTHIEVARQSTVTDNLDHKVMLVPGHKKRDLLLHLIDEEKPSKALIFVRTRRDADAVSDFLAESGFKTASLHGDKQQKMRLRITNNFKSGLYDFLVATDVAARGLDVKDISHVFNMDVPVEAESYVHRIGRTARGSAHGRAITLCGKSELNLLRAIENLIKQQIERDDNHPFPMPKSHGKPGGKSRETAARKRPSVAARKGKAFAGKKDGGKFARKPSGKSFGKPADRYSGKPSAKPFEKSAEGSAERRTDRPARKSFDRPRGKPFAKAGAERRPYAVTDAVEGTSPAKGEGRTKPGHSPSGSTARRSNDKPAGTAVREPGKIRTVTKGKPGGKVKTVGKKRPAIAAKKARALAAKKAGFSNNFKASGASSKNQPAHRSATNNTKSGNQPLRRRSK